MPTPTPRLKSGRLAKKLESSYAHLISQIAATSEPSSLMDRIESSDAARRNNNHTNRFCTQLFFLSPEQRFLGGISAYQAPCSRWLVSLPEVTGSPAWGFDEAQGGPPLKIEIYSLHAAHALVKH